MSKVKASYIVKYFYFINIFDPILFLTSLKSPKNPAYGTTQISITANLVQNPNLSSEEFIQITANTYMFDEECKKKCKGNCICKQWIWQENRSSNFKMRRPRFSECWLLKVFKKLKMVCWYPERVPVKRTQPLTLTELSKNLVKVHFL